MSMSLQYGHWNTARQERRLPEHRNHGLELVWVANGEVTWDYGGREVHVPPGKISFSWPWQRHGACRERVALVELYWLILPLESGMRRVRQPRLDRRLAPVAEAVNPTGFLEELLGADPPVLPTRPALRKAFAETVRALEKSGGCPGPHVWGWLTLVFAELLEIRRQQTESGAIKDPDIARSFLTELKGRLGEPWTLERMAEACGMGRTRFAAAVKEVSGDTPMRTLNRMRIESAVRCIRKGEETIAEIAYAHGFGSSQYFATVCKRLTGNVPGRYRER